MPNLRATTAADIGAINALLAASYPRLLAADYAASLLETVLPRITEAQPALLSSGTYYVVTDGAETLAAGGWTISAPGPKGTVSPGVGHVRHVAAHPDHLRQGHARRVMSHVLTTAKAAGLRQLDCLSTLTAVPFYAAMGFDIRDHVEVPLAPGVAFPSVRMLRTL